MSLVEGYTRRKNDPSERALVVMNGSPQDPDFCDLIRTALFDSDDTVVDQAVKRYCESTPEKKAEIVPSQILAAWAISIGDMRPTAIKLLSGRKDVDDNTVRWLFEANDSDTREALSEYYRGLKPEEKRELLPYNTVYGKVQHTRRRGGEQEFWMKLFTMFPSENEEQQETIRQVMDSHLCNFGHLNGLIDYIKANRMLVSPAVIDRMGQLYSWGDYDSLSLNDVVDVMERAVDPDKIDSETAQSWANDSDYRTKQALIVRLVLSGKGGALRITSYSFLFGLMLYAIDRSNEALIREINAVYRGLSLDEKKLAVPTGARNRRGTLIYEIDENPIRGRAVCMFCYGRTDLSAEDLRFLWRNNYRSNSAFFIDSFGGIISQRIKDGYRCLSNGDGITSLESSISEAIKLEKDLFGKTDAEATAYVQEQIRTAFLAGNPLSVDEANAIMAAAKASPEYMFCLNVSDEWKRQQIMPVIERAAWNEGVVGYIRTENSIWESISDDFIVALSKDIVDTASQAHMLAIDLCAARDKALVETVLSNVFERAKGEDEITLAITSALNAEFSVDKILGWALFCPGLEDHSIKRACLATITRGQSTKN